MMKTYRMHAVVVATLATLAVGHEAMAQQAAAPGGTPTIRLDTVQKLWIDGNLIGPKNNGTPVIGKNTGAGVMDSEFAVDHTVPATSPDVIIGTTYTRSSNTPNGNNSYMQGGFALAKINETTGVQLGTKVDLPQLNGERAFMRPLIEFTPKYVVLVAAAEDNESNNGNPKPVLYLADKATGALVTIPNNPRRNQTRPGGAPPLDLMRLAVRSGIQVQNENNQRGPHLIRAVSDNSFIVGMQYNNQAQEAFRVTVNDDATVTMNWVQRYSNNAVHTRPQVAFQKGATSAFMVAGECNTQPIDVGYRMTEFNVDTGRAVQTKIVMRAQPNQNKRLTEPHIAFVNPTTLAVSGGYTQMARVRNGNNGHAGGANVTTLALYGAAAGFTPVGETMIAPANYQRHANLATTEYGPEGATSKAAVVISGSSTGTGAGLAQVIPLKADGTLGLKDPLKMYKLSTYSDVANVQARGKRNPNNQARGFINAVGDVRNPGYGKAGGFYPEVKSFTFSAVTGYSDDTAKGIGRRNSLVLSLIPSVWKAGVNTTPGTPTETAGTAPAPVVTAPATVPQGDTVSPGAPSGNVVDGEETTPENADSREGGGARSMGESNGGCSISQSSDTSTNGVALFGIALAGAFFAARRRKVEGK